MLTADIINQFVEADERQRIIEESIVQSVTVDLALCFSCANELRDHDLYCRRCGVKQRYDSVTEELRAMRKNYNTERLPQLPYGSSRVSASLLKNIADGVSETSSRFDSRLLKGTISMLIAFPLWIIIILLSPFDAYITARTIAGQS